MNLLLKSILVLSFVTSISVSANDNEITRRGFFGFLGGGAVASAAIASGGLDSVAGIFEEGSLNSSKLIEHLRTSLKKSGFLNPDSPSNILNADTKIHEYERILKILDSDKSLPANAKAQVGDFIKELEDIYYRPNVAAVKPEHYKSPTGNTNAAQGRQSASENKISEHAFYEILKVRSFLTVRLLNRLNWQNQYPNDLVLRDQQGSRDVQDLTHYKTNLIRLLLPADSPIRNDEFMKAYVLFLIKEVNMVLTSEPVEDWRSSQVMMGNNVLPKTCQELLN